MRNFGKVLDEINTSLNKFVIFQEMLTAIILFLGFFVFLTFFRFDFIDPYFAAVPAGVYLGIELFYRINRDKLVIVESKYDFLNEKLRTAADNIYMQNEVVDSLQKEIVNDLSRVSTASFLDMKQASFKIIVVLVICFLIIFLNTFHIMGLSINVGDLSNIDMNDLPITKGEGPADIFAGGPGGVSDIPADEDIFGIEEVAKLGDDELEMGIKSMGYEINVRNVQYAEKREYDEVFPSDYDVAAVSASAFEEDIPEEQKAVVSSYFEDLARK